MARTSPICLTYTQFIAPTMAEHTTRFLTRLSSSTQRTANYSLHVNEYISISRGYACFFFLGWRFGPQMLQTACFLSKQLPFIKCFCLFWKKETKDKVKVKQIWEYVLLEQKICFVWNLWHCFQQTQAFISYRVWCLFKRNFNTRRKNIFYLLVNLHIVFKV